ncbi:MAG: TIGR03936 family radical SAM-associated protein [Planctomycetota bacterium]
MTSFWRYRIRFGKRRVVRFISHRDLMDAFARSFRRAGLPVRMSQGFHPRPRFSLPAPLPLGIEGLDEVLEVDLVRPLDAEAVADRLGRATPDGIDILRARQLGPGQKARVHSATYRVRGDVTQRAIDRLLGRSTVTVTRRGGKEVDIRPYIERVSRSDRGWEFELLVTNAGTARPAEVVDELCGNGGAAASRMVRTHVNLDPS